jgi:hypothetical protein
VTRESRFFDLGPVGAIKVFESEEGHPVVVIFTGAEEDGTPAITHVWDLQAINGLIALGRHLQSWHQVRMPASPPDSSDKGGLTIKPI